MKRAFTIGIDYGTNSVRSVVVDCADGREVGTSVFDYPSGEQGILLDPGNPHLARQNPADYVAGLEASVKGALVEAAGEDGFSPEAVVGIGVDTTGSTPMPVNSANRPLALDPKWKDNLELSSQRALTVVRYLIGRGIDDKRIRAVGCGAARPVASNSNSAGKAKNRRVEIVVYMR